MLQLNDIRKRNIIYLTGLTLLVAGLPVSLFLTSLSQFFLVGSFLIEGNVKEKFKRFASNKALVLFTCIWGMHLIGLAWTSNYAEGLKDIRIKLPLLLLPLIIGGTAPLTAKEFRMIMTVFIVSVFAGTVSAIAVLTGVIHRDIYDIRDIFIYHISHIRFALFTCIAILVLIRMNFFERSISKSARIPATLLTAWFIVFLFIVQSVTGIVVLISVLFLTLVYYLFKTPIRRNRIILIVCIITIPVTILGLSVRMINEFYTIKSYPINTNDKTSLGNDYTFLSDGRFENGYPVSAYICDSELRESWNKRSVLSYDSTDNRGQMLKSTLIRFLSSKGWRKDAEAVSNLTDAEVKSIQNGVANVNFEKLSSFRMRLFQIIWEFDNMFKGGDPSGHSVAQRFEFWKAAAGIIGQQPILGVGTGDLIPAYKEQYAAMNTKLDDAHRLRAHNQYLSICVAFGFVGLLFFLFALIFPFRNYKKLPALFVLFMIIFFISMFSEDTLETQPGATFAGFFFAIFLEAD